MSNQGVSPEEIRQFHCAQNFVKDNELIFRNALLQSFMQSQEHWALLEESLRCPSSDATRILDKKFKEHFSEISLISLLSNEIRRFAIRYDQRYRRNTKRQMLILDRPRYHDSQVTTWMELIPSKKSLEQEAFQTEERLENRVENPIIHKAINELTARQKFILEAAYIHECTDTEIAQIDGVSQQTISKTRKKALQNIYSFLQREGE
ncbi:MULTISPECIES: sigma-70 family RNA polymerase sigma factor [Oceanobacillus]|uniref:RNA polymerase sigma-70 region 4 domain-containing protein n=1 Tax=Oceanobacillus kimchii TaxID=746691 RepID=A0ABQ5TK18_9BACI|nr:MULTISPECIES: sigma-70 family RNA polymerase sigma factor [Oceanobacillus]MBT2600166.1 sigma-70 family RNA polymerase sigma factor [Oceanobacillus sp. ISL-74]MBT2650324.1 sigma-70 family RNA polymerase sigma factor [Oceanobacillus sp. ISL-73]OEH55121.1 hypothetical protein AQ616_08740 [Oceanobacillus sp. E9]GLO67208.1 hypothetical protein MACH08_29920 [Oceanobacillus kimchii]